MFSFKVPGIEMPSGSVVMRFVFETTDETLNAIKNAQLEMIKTTWNGQLKSRTQV